MNDTAPTAVQDLLASRPQKAVVADLFTFTLLSGPVYRFTDWRKPITLGGVTWAPGSPRVGRGPINVERGITVGTTEVTLQEANAGFIAKIAQGYFNRAIFKQQRVFAADLSLVWLGPITKFFGRINGIADITGTAAKLTAKTALDELDNDYPRQVLQPDCDAVLFDARCGLNEAGYLVNGSAGAGSTRNTLITGLGNPDGYFTQGTILWTSGAMSGLRYMVKKHVGGVVTPSYPFLAMPSAGDTFALRPGCDKTLATCIGKFGYNSAASAAPYFRGTPNIPDPTVTY